MDRNKSKKSYLVTLEVMTISSLSLIICSSQVHPASLNLVTTTPTLDNLLISQDLTPDIWLFFQENESLQISNDKLISLNQIISNNYNNSDNYNLVDSLQKSLVQLRWFGESDADAAPIILSQTELGNTGEGLYYFNIELNSNSSNNSSQQAPNSNQSTVASYQGFISFNSKRSEEINHYSQHYNILNSNFNPGFPNRNPSRTLASLELSIFAHSSLINNPFEVHNNVISNPGDRGTFNQGNQQNMGFKYDSSVQQALNNSPVSSYRNDSYISPNNVKLSPQEKQLQEQLKRQREQAEQRQKVLRDQIRQQMEQQQRQRQEEAKQRLEQKERERQDFLKRTIQQR